MGMKSTKVYIKIEILILGSTLFWTIQLMKDNLMNMLFLAYHTSSYCF